MSSKECQSLLLQSFHWERAVLEWISLDGFGRVGSDRHKEYKLRIQRRDALTDIERRSRLIQELIDAELTQPIWEPEPKDSDDSASKTICKSLTKAHRQTVRTEGFNPGDCVKLPSGHRAYVEKILDNGRVAITWEIGKIKDDFPPHLLELVS